MTPAMPPTSTAMTWLVKAAAVGLALAFSAGMALAFELAMDSTLLG